MTYSPTEVEHGIVEVVMPQMGVSVAEGEILQWHKEPGDVVAEDEVLCDATTDKVDVEIPAPTSGMLLAILADAGSTVEVGKAIAQIQVGDGESPDPARAAPKPDGDPSPVGSNGSADHPADRPGRRDRSTFLSPIVRRMVETHELNPSLISGTGVGGRIRKQDVMAHLESRDRADNGAPPALHSDSPYQQAQELVARDAALVAQSGDGLAVPASMDGDRRERMSAMRRAIARHMVESRRTSAHVTTAVEVDMSTVVARRAQLQEPLGNRGIKLTYLAFIAEAVVGALQEFPVLNSSIEGDELVHHSAINLGIAVALDPDGLIVPVIRGADRLSIAGLAEAIDDLAIRARSKDLGPDELEGGTFTITNPGQYGAVFATPIINQPQVAILDVEAIVKRPVAIGDAIAVRPMCFLPMSWDHRALDGVTAARFLSSVRSRLEAAHDG